MTAVKLSSMLHEIADEAVGTTPDPWPTLRSRLERRGGRSTSRFQHWQLAAAVVAVLAVAASLVSLASSSESVSAAEILERAVTATSSGPLGPISSYHLLATRTTTPPSGIFNEQAIEAWFSAPDRRQQTIRCGDCPTAITSDVITRSDRTWSITTVDGHAYVLEDVAPEANVDLLVPTGSTPAEMLRRAQQMACGTASVRGEASVAGRPAYVVAVERRAGDSCPTAPGIGGLGRLLHTGQTDTFWIDKESYLLLRSEQHMPQERVGNQLVTYVVSSVEYNPPLPEAVFAYTPPTGATVVRTAAELKSALSRILVK